MRATTNMPSIGIEKVDARLEGLKSSINDAGATQWRRRPASLAAQADGARARGGTPTRRWLSRPR